MYSIKTIIAIFTVSVFTLSCSKDDGPPIPEEKDIAFENNVPVSIIDFNAPGNFITRTLSEINVTGDGTIKDISKVTLEMNIEHSFQSDLSFVLIAPDNSYEAFVYRCGSSGDYLATSKLRFNSTFTDMLPDGNEDFPSGNYRQSTGSRYNNLTFPLDPIFQFLQNKSIKGIWKLQTVDYSAGDTGSIKSWKLIFEKGALSQ
jgi:subtilisin-like proprotein convertase family protein